MCLSPQTTRCSSISRESRSWKSTALRCTFSGCRVPICVSWLAIQCFSPVSSRASSNAGWVSNIDTAVLAEMIFRAQTYQTFDFVSGRRRSATRFATSMTASSLATSKCFRRFSAHQNTDAEDDLEGLSLNEGSIWRRYHDEQRTFTKKASVSRVSGNQAFLLPEFEVLRDHFCANGMVALPVLYKRFHGCRAPHLACKQLLVQRPHELHPASGRDEFQHVRHDTFHLGTDTQRLPPPLNLTIL
mmetsp:Transcript_12424/g.27134  ORF Transcript_12424/g.27134 Transcript_12424/m.27134 type:complete len:244 (-) Transcript_12424:865-1596(-)